MDSQPSHSVPQPQPPQTPDSPLQGQAAENRNLGQEDLGSIFPPRWLHDQVVDTFIGRLCRTLPGQAILILSTTLDLLCNSLMKDFRSMRAGGPAMTEAEIEEDYKHLRIQAATVTGTRGMVFMPFCVGNHWIMAVADLKYRTLHVYDSKVIDSGDPSLRVRYVVVPVAKRILSFCLDEDDWTVKVMWFPIEPNDTECGVYICMMALQTCYQRGFTHHDYAVCFRGIDGFYLPYKLEGCYWLAARWIILQVCRRFSSSAQIYDTTSELGADIIGSLRDRLDNILVQSQVPGFNTYLMALSWTLGRVINALSGICTSIENLASPERAAENAAVQQKTLDVILTPSGQQFRNEVVAEVMSNARHTSEPPDSLMDDYGRAAHGLIHELQLAKIRRAGRLAAAPQPSPADVPTSQPSSAGNSSPSSSALGENPTMPSPSATHLEPSTSCEPEDSDTE